MSICSQHLLIQHIYWMPQYPGLQRAHRQEKYVCNYQVMGMIFLKPEITHSNGTRVPLRGNELIPLHCSNHLWSFPPGIVLRAYSLSFWISSMVPTLHWEWIRFLEMAKSQSEPSLVSKMYDQTRWHYFGSKMIHDYKAMRWISLYDL